MKKITKLLMPVSAIALSSAIVVPLASCSSQVEEGVKVNVTVSSTDGVSLKESKAELNKDSTITLNMPSMKVIKDLYVSVGTQVLVKDTNYSVDVNTNVVTINAASMTSKDVVVTVFTTKMNGIKVSAVDSSKKFESLESIKASDVKVSATYEQTPIGTVNPLTYGTDYIVYDKDSGEEIPNFDTVGYTVKREEGRLGTKSFDFEYVPYDKFANSLTLNTTEKYEPKEIKEVDACRGKFVGDTITPADLIVVVNMTDPSTNATQTKVLEWGTGYTVWVEGNELTDFGTNGYTLTGTNSDELVIKSVENPEEALQTVKFNVQPVELKNALCMTNDGETASITLSSQCQATSDFKYSTNNGTSWNDVTVGTAIDLEKGKSIQFKATTNVSTSFSALNQFEIVSKDTSAGKEAKVSLSGSILGILNNNVASATPATLPEYFFTSTFANCTALTSVSKDFLGQIGLTKQCYNGMFGNCTSLTQAPDLPNSAPNRYSCNNMFLNCTSLKAMPKLPATDVVDEGSYAHMFEGCTSLTDVSEICSKTLRKTTCYQMFKGCTSLETAPIINATTLEGEGPCYEMFIGCTSLKTATTLKPATLVKGSYYNMFSGCTSLINAPEIKATTMAENSCLAMFKDCTSLEIAPALPAKTLGGQACYSQMFQNCSSLTQAPTLPATELVDYCYGGMFMNCTSLETAPALPAETLTKACYSNMFNGCTSLKNAPKLPATPTVNSVYKMMFYKCSSLEIAVDEGDEDHKILTAIDASAMTNVYFKMFDGTKNIPDPGESTEGLHVEEGKTYYWVE